MYVVRRTVQRVDDPAEGLLRAPVEILFTKESMIGKPRLDDADNRLLRGKVSFCHQVRRTFLADREAVRPLLEHVAPGAGRLDCNLAVLIFVHGFPFVRVQQIQMGSLARRKVNAAGLCLASWVIRVNGPAD